METIQFQNTVEDMVAFARYKFYHPTDFELKQQEKDKRLVKTVAILFVLGIAVSAASVWANSLVEWMYFLGGALLLIILGWSKRVVQFSSEFDAESTRNIWYGEPYAKQLEQRIKMSITPESITVESEDGDFTNRWRSFERVAITDEHIFLCLEPNPTGYVIPCRVFQSEDDFVQFGFALRKYHQSDKESACQD